MLLSILFPVLSNTYSNISKALTIYENHRTERGFENAMTQKTFILSFLTGYLSIFLTAYVYGTSQGSLRQCRSGTILFRTSISR
jgi:anoctamin-10